MHMPYQLALELARTQRAELERSARRRRAPRSPRQWSGQLFRRRKPVVPVASAGALPAHV